MSGANASSRVTSSEAGPVTSIDSTRWPERVRARAMAAMVSGESNSASSSESVTRRLCVSATRILPLCGLLGVSEDPQRGQVVVHAHALGLEVAGRVRVGGDDQRNAADHGHPEVAQRG